MEKEIIYCVFCGAENSTKSDKCCKCGKTLHPKDDINGLEQYIKKKVRSKAKSEAEGKTLDFLFKRALDFFKGSLLNYILAFSLIFSVAQTVTRAYENRKNSYPVAVIYLYEAYCRSPETGFSYFANNYDSSYPIFGNGAMYQFIQENGIDKYYIDGTGHWEQDIQEVHQWDSNRVSLYLIARRTDERYEPENYKEEIENLKTHWDNVFVITTVKINGQWYVAGDEKCSKPFMDIWGYLYDENGNWSGLYDENGNLISEMETGGNG